MEQLLALEMVRVTDAATTLEVGVGRETVDIAVDPLDGTDLVAMGHGGCPHMFDPERPRAVRL